MANSKAGVSRLSEPQINDTGLREEMLEHTGTEFFTNVFLDHQSVTHETPSGRHKYLICLGDSRGQVHMNHLYLP